MRELRRKAGILLLICFIQTVTAQQSPLQRNNLPFFGAQVFIEPGQSGELIESWFKTLKENGMSACRIRMFESYMLQPDGSWDFTLFDHAFRAAAKYHIKIYCTLFPATEKTDIGGWKFPEDEAEKESFARFIKALVSHYKDHPALYGWVIINEPGMDGRMPKTDFSKAARAQWNKNHIQRDYKENGYPVLMTTHDYEFLNDLTTSFLRWIAGEIKKYDSKHDIHVNPAGIFGNYEEYNFPVWRKFLTSLGGSAHPSWHFNYFTRQQYTMAMLSISELIRSGAGDLPWFMTEIQGGNNTYSGGNAMCPTPEEIAQWLWVALGCESKGAIFWMLNPRSSGIEAGEWAMIDFQGKPSERLLAAKEVSEAVAANAELFKTPCIISSGIDVVYFNESLWAENLMAIDGDMYQGRQPGAVIKSPIACLRALTERGVNAGLKNVNEYDFTQKDYSGKSIIISNQISIPAKYREPLEAFVSRGGTLLVEGMSAFFDEDLHNTMNTGFTFKKLFGGNISEFILKENLFTLGVEAYNLPVHLWLGKIAGQDSLVKKHSFGKGQVIWLPSTVALGAWVSGDYRAFSDYLFAVLPKAGSTISFDRHYDNVIMRTLQSGTEKLIICINKSTKEETITLNNAGDMRSAKQIFASPGCQSVANKLTMSSEGILVIRYKP